MIPSIIHERLGQLRRRERLLRFVWGLARTLAVIVAAIAFGCLVDWTWDRFEDTPEALRSWLAFLSVGVAVVAAIAWIALPLVQRLRDDDLALWVEDRAPSLKQRLISAVQLNRPGARSEGMSE